MIRSLPLRELDISPGSELRDKAQRLFDLLKGMDGLVVAFSGGVDSGLLCAVGQAALGERMLAVTVRSMVESTGDNAVAQDLARLCGFTHRVVDFDDLANPQFVANPPDRCYHCKLARFLKIQEIAAQFSAQHGMVKAWVAEGSNADDSLDYRPGARAVAELGIRSPLAEAGLTKADIRAIAHALDLPVWNRPSAPCLATRFPYGTPVTQRGLGQVADGERFLRENGFQPVRVRHYGKTARLEVPAERLEELIACREEVIIYFKQLGFTYVVADMAGYRMGSMNEVLGK
jgi:uncharacterized protein